MMSIESIPKLIFISLAIISIIALTAIYNISQIQTEDLEMDVIFNRIMYSPNAISYTDINTGRTYLGIIDPARIEDSILDKAIVYPKERSYSANITLLGSGITKTGYLQKDWFVRFAPLGRSGIQGEGGIDYFKKEIPITYVSGEDFLRGKLIIEVAKPRR